MFKPTIVNGEYQGLNGLKWIEFSTPVRDLMESKGYSYVGSMSNKHRFDAFNPKSKMRGATHFYSILENGNWTAPETTLQVAKRLGIEDEYDSLGGAKKR